MSIRVLKQGILASVQSLPRNGYRHLGIGSGGAMDAFAMQVANSLVGNEEDAAVIEMHFPAPEILFLEDALISLAGADFDACAGEEPLPAWKPCFITKGSVLKCRKPVWGSKLYLAVRGGWEAEQWLGSRSTHLKVAAAGFRGRTFQKEDVIGFANQPAVSGKQISGWNITVPDLPEIYPGENSIRCIRGPEWGLLSEISKDTFDKETFAISHQSDRMGYRLTGSPMNQYQPVEMVSSPVDAGTVQLLPDGNLIVLMADHQTTGGYPRVASVLQADMPALAQLNPGNRFCFTIVEPRQAEEALISRKQNLQAIKERCLRYYQTHNPH